MINSVIDFSANNRLIIFALTIAACLLGWWSMQRLSLDALPDLSENQVIIYSRWDRSPRIIEDQVTYPIVSALLGAPGVKNVRGVSDFGSSFVYVLFDDDKDIYWARSRTQEYLAGVLPTLPEGVKTELGPDASGVGWVFQYALEDTESKFSLAELRSLQDWYIRYHLKSVQGVAEVAPVGGYKKQYQIQLDPNRLREFDVSIGQVVEAVRESNNEVGGRLLEVGGTEYLVRGLGYANSVDDFGNILLTKYDESLPVRIKDVGTVNYGPDIRRGATDLDGNGEVVSGIVIVRQGQNALDVIKRVKEKIIEIEPGLPEGVKIVPIYDRSSLILRAISTLKTTLIHEIIVVVAIIFFFLWHIPSAIIPAVTIPIVVLLTFIPLKMMGVTANVMSLGGIAIAIGALIDASIVVVEQTHKKLEDWQAAGKKESYRDVVLSGIKQVAGPSFFALLVIAVSFLPVFALEDQEGRLFTPLAYTKNFAMIIAAILAITLDPALRISFMSIKEFSFKPLWVSKVCNLFTRDSFRAEKSHPVIRILTGIYKPVVEWSLRWQWLVITVALLAMIITIPVYKKLGKEFMPPLDEGSILYMPSTMPGISIAEAQKLLKITNGIIKQFPEVDRVLGKVGRAETATDPAPLSMIETVITLHSKDRWRSIDTWYSSWSPEWLKFLFRQFTPDTLSTEELIRQMDDALDITGLVNGWTMPIKGRIEMLNTGMRTPVGLKISGADLKIIEDIGLQLETILPQVPGTRSVFAEKTDSGFFLDIIWNREQLALYGLRMKDAQLAVQSAIGGDNITTTVEGRERYPVSVRYARDYRSDINQIGRVLVSSSDGKRHIPLSQLADLKVNTGPAMIRNENGLLTGYVYVDVEGLDPYSYINMADEKIREHVTISPGYSLSWSGQYESMQRVKERLLFIVPLTFILILVLLYINTRSTVKTFIVLLSVPFSAIGAVWILYLLGYNVSVAVWVGLIALLGVDAETGIFMLLYLDLAYESAKKKGRLRNRQELKEAILEGAVKRIRPKFMTVTTTFIGLLPIMWMVGTGADVMKRIAAPMVGGIITSFLLELLIYPVIYELWKWNFEVKGLGFSKQQ